MDIGDGIKAHGELTQEQIVAFKETFNYFDKNGDGVISAQELVIAMKHLGMTSASTKTEDILREFDTNGDGMIDAYEFFNMMGEKIRNMEDNKEDMREAFEIFDTNCNGCISIPELRSVMKDFEDDITEEQVENIINEFHIEGGGQINYENFLAMLAITD